MTLDTRMVIGSNGKRAAPLQSSLITSFHIRLVLILNQPNFLSVYINISVSILRRKEMGRWWMEETSWVLIDDAVLNFSMENGANWIFVWISSGLVWRSHFPPLFSTYFVPRGVSRGSRWLFRDYESGNLN